MSGADTPMRLTAVLTHPVQYFAPWFRYIASRRPEIALTVLYGAIPTPEQQGSGFGVAFEWDVPLTDSYVSQVCSTAAGKRFDSDAFFGVDVPDIGSRIAATRPDVVLVTGWHAAMQVRAIRECRRRGIPLVYRGDSTLRTAPRPLLQPAWRLKTRWMLRQFDGWLSVGSDATGYLRSFGIPEPLIASSPHCVDNEFFATQAAVLRSPDERARLRAAVGLSDRDFVVLLAGKLQAGKRPLDAVAAVAGLGRDAVLMVAGDGALATAVRDEAARRGVRLVERGFVNQSAMPATFAMADALLFPSARETWGLVVNEALASGVPCVVTRGVTAGRDLIVDGDNGFTTDVGDTTAMATALTKIRAHRDHGHDLATACRARVASSGFDRATDGLVAASRRVLHQRRVAVDRNPGHPRIIMCAGGMVKVFGLERTLFETVRVVHESGAAVHAVVNRHDSSAIVPHLEAIGASWSTGYYAHAPKRRLRSWREAALIVWDALRTSAGLLRDAARFRPSHVLLADFGMALRNFPALLLLRAAGTRVVHKVGNAPDDGTFYRRMWRYLVNPVVDVFIANSAFTAGELERVGVPTTKVRIVHDTAPTRPRFEGAAGRDDRRVIYVGQIIPPKGVSLLLEAVALLRTRDPQITLDVVGDIDGWEPPAWDGYRRSLRARAEQPDLRGAVRFLGTRDDVPALLEMAAVHCCPSLPEIREAFGMVNVEAKLAGIPSVVLPSGALPELIEHRRDGWVCADATADALAEGLDYFLSDRERREAAGRQARASFARFRRDVFAAEWRAAFDMVAETASLEVAQPAGIGVTRAD